MTVTLTDQQACSFTGVDDITDSDIETAAWLIRTNTTLTPDEHNTLRNIPEDVVRRAWSIVAARTRIDSRGVGDDAVTSETQGDYSYTVDLGRREQWRGDLLHGLPRELLGTSIGTWSTVRPGQRVMGRRDGSYWEIT